MAYIVVSQAYDDAFLDDKPAIVTTINDLPEAVYWEDNGNNVIEDALYPPENALDGVPLVYTRPNINAVTGSVRLHIQFPAPGVSFDTLGFINHNMGDMTNVFLRLQIANLAVPGTNLVSAGTAFLNNKRELHFFPNLYTQVEHIFFTFNKVNWATTDKPYLGQVIIGRRWQLANHQNEPSSPEKAITKGESFSNNYGADYFYAQGRGLKQLEFDWNPAGVNDALKYQGGAPPPGMPYHDNGAVFDLAYNFTKAWSKPFVYCPKPNSFPNKFYWVKKTNHEHNLIHVIANVHKEYTLQMDEIGPSYDSEINGW